MEKNIGSVDRAMRILVAIAIAVLYFTNQITGTVAIIFLILAGIFALTSFLSFCPIYYLSFGFSTRKKADRMKLHNKA